MRAVLSVMCALTLLWISGSARAGNGNNGGNSDKSAVASTGPAAATAPSTDAKVSDKDTKAPANPTQPVATGSSTAPAASSPATESEIQQLRDLLESQQAEIAALKEQLSVTHSVNAVPAAVVSAPAGAPHSSGPWAAVVAGHQQTETASGEPSPLSIKIGTAEFTPGGFIDMMDTWRSTNVGSGIGTTFSSIPYNNNSTGTGGLSENRISAQNSRLNLKITTPAAGGNLLGYLETDFNGNAPTNLYNTRNSATLRLRLFFADYTRGDWEILGGQAWSMLTPNRKGIDALPADEFGTLLLDSNNSVGLVSARQAQFRLIFHPTDRWTLGASVENSDPFTGTALTLPACFTGTGSTNSGCASQTNQIDQGTATTSPGSFPDIVVKVARDQQVGGKNWHFETAGFITNDKLYTPTSASTGPGASQSKTGGGISFNMDLQLTQTFHLITNSFWSDGGGRYLYTTGPNFVVFQNPTSLNFVPSLEHAGAGLAGFEWQATKKFQWFSYYGGNYFSRNYSVDPTAKTPGTLVGYGYPGSPNSQNRELQELSTGFIQSFWKSENYGALQFITQGSYITRSPWNAGTGPKNAHEAVLYLDLRYIIP